MCMVSMEAAHMCMVILEAENLGMVSIEAEHMCAVSKGAPMFMKSIEQAHVILYCLIDVHILDRGI
jgi:GTP cyclohydrolase I